MELRAGLRLLLALIVNLQLLVAGVTQLFNVIVVGVLLQGEYGCCCHLMSHPGLSDMEPAALALVINI